jgi:hypothetical protein
MAEEKDTKLVTALRQAKQQPMLFAFVAKGASEGALIVSKKKIPIKEINEAKQETGGKKVIRGRCVGEDGKMVFEVAKEPPSTLAKQLKKVIQESAGMMLQVETRVAADLEDEEEESETEGGETTEQTNHVPPAPPPTTQPDSAAARFAARLKALAPIVAKIEAANVKQQIAEANKLYIGKQYDAANAALDQAELLLKQVQSSPSTSENDPAQARFAARLKALAPVVQKIEATGSPLVQQAKVQIATANKLYLAKQYQQANETLDQAEALVKQALTGGAPQGSLSVMKLGKARIEWGGIRTMALQDIKRLQTALKDEFQDDAEQLPQLTDCLKKLDSLLTDFNEELDNQLDAVLNAKDEGQRRSLAQTAKATMARFVQLVDKDPVVKALDGNEMIPDMQVAAPMRAKLQEIATALG